VEHFYRPVILSEAKDRVCIAQTCDGSWCVRPSTGLNDETAGNGLEESG